jgi:HORMA domain-containing protein
VSTTVRVSSAVYSATHVTTNMLRGLKQIILGCGLDATTFGNQFKVLEKGVATWVRSRHLRELTLEVWDPTRPDRLVGRFDFTIDYSYYGSGDGGLSLDSATVAWVIKKNGTYPSRCDYRIIADTAPGAPHVDGWASTSLRDTTGLRRYSVGTALGGGSTAAGLSYWKS